MLLSSTSRWAGIMLGMALALAPLALGQSKTPAVTPDYDEIGKGVYSILSIAHYARTPLNAPMSEKAFETYLRELDPNKIFFTQKDVDKLRDKHASTLGITLQNGFTADTAKQLYTIYQEKARKRYQEAKQLLKANKLTFQSTDSVERSRKERPWCKDDAELDALWKKLIEDQLLTEILRRDTTSKRAMDQGKPDPNKKEKPPEEKIRLRYERMLRTLNEGDTEDMANALLNAVALTYDPHTEYMGARATDAFKSSLGASLVGIGALLGADDDGTTKVNGITRGGPAEKSGLLKLGDKIVGVDTTGAGEMVDIMFMELDKVVSIIRGKEGVPVRLKIIPANSPADTKIINIKRSQIDMKEELVKANIIDTTLEDGTPVRLGVITLPSFYADLDGGDRHCSQDVEKMLVRLMKDKVQGIVLDLRNNGGGSLQDVAKICGYFTEPGPVVQVRDAKGGIEVLNSTRKHLYTHFKGALIVLHNKLSASASEIFAAAMQDYGRALIVGDQSSYGKGTVQQPIELKRFFEAKPWGTRSGLLKLTTHTFFRVAGGTTQLKGVESDIVLPSITAAYQDIGEAKAKHALPYSEIPQAKGYTRATDIATIIPALSQRSAARVAQNKDLQTTLRDVAKATKKFKDNSLSLNKKIRKQESLADEADRKEILTERKTRYAQIVAEDLKNFRVYSLSLDNIDQQELPLVDPKADLEKNMTLASELKDEFSDIPDHPSGIDPELRETISILKDIITLSEK